VVKLTEIPRAGKVEEVRKLAGWTKRTPQPNTILKGHRANGVEGGGRGKGGGGKIQWGMFNQSECRREGDKCYLPGVES